MIRRKAHHKPPRLSNTLIKEIARHLWVVESEEIQQAYRDRGSMGLRDYVWQKYASMFSENEIIELTLLLVELLHIYHPDLPPDTHKIETHKE